MADALERWERLITEAENKGNDVTSDELRTLEKLGKEIRDHMKALCERIQSMKNLPRSTENPWTQISACRISFSKMERCFLEQLIRTDGLETPQHVLTLAKALWPNRYARWEEKIAEAPPFSSFHWIHDKRETKKRRSDAFVERLNILAAQMTQKLMEQKIGSIRCRGTTYCFERAKKGDEE